jgi:transcriptional regulator
MFVPRPDAASLSEVWQFVRAHGFGQLIAPGAGRDLPVVVPTQYVVRETGELPDPGLVVLHLARPNPVWAALTENPRCLLSVAGDWAYIPGAWKAVGVEDPARGIPTTYYAAAQLVCRAEIVDDPAELLAILRVQLSALDRTGSAGLVDPSEHAARLPAIRGLRLVVEEVRGKMKFGGNVDAEHRLAVADRLAARNAPGDRAARAHLLRRLTAESG